MKNISVSASTHPYNKDITLISVKGFIDTNTAPEFDKTFQSVLGENKFKLIVDLKDVNYISSAGWGIFVGEIKRIRNQKGNLFLVGMSAEVEEAYDLLQFSTILKSFPNVDQAIQSGFGLSSGSKTVVENRAGKEPENASNDKNLGKTQAETPVQSSMGSDPSKPHWFARIFMPWKWF